ncbi:hypothetical protein BDN70DRAFT_932935 [Pholiota conissans]|uniref:MYND-type domain-containing protein n=1 Tax=Pholiota conissans TaxID=109636 RepID=A0A9P5Z1J9_9AGAR|nr:hypothetical protein BDN70DRAFT_932935 [Pholiota conissans]
MQSLLQVRFCGNPVCKKELSKVLVCASCRARSYCNKVCQRLDWGFHRQFCTPRSDLSRNARLVQAYNRRYQALTVTLALEFLNFVPAFSYILSEDERRAEFLPLAEQYFLHVYLRRLDRPVRGRHRKLSFSNARLDSINRLPEHVQADIRHRLRAPKRFPAVVIGYTVLDAAGSPTDQELVTTFTHGFAWPPPGTQGLGVIKTTQLIILWEWICAMEDCQQARLAAVVVWGHRRRKETPYEGVKGRRKRRAPACGVSRKLAGVRSKVARSVGAITVAIVVVESGKSQGMGVPECTDSAGAPLVETGGRLALNAFVRAASTPQPIEATTLPPRREGAGG